MSRLHIMETKLAIQVMLNYPPIDPTNPILNSCPLDLALIYKYQQLDQPLLKAVKEDK